MEDFRRQFLIETAEKLENLQFALLDSEELSAENKRETFRMLHTVKGTAQTFGYGAASRLAHDLESLLSADKTGQNLIVEGIKFLRKSLTEDNFKLPEQFAEKLQKIIPHSPEMIDLNAELPEIPSELYSQLSSLEKEKVNAAVRGGKSLAVLEVGFESANFAVGLINFREIITSSGEIIATFPSTKFTSKNKIGFQFLVADLENAQSLAEANNASVLWENSTANPIDNIAAIVRQIVKHGREVAAKFDKEIEIETKSDEMNLSSDELKLVFDTLLHLVRNAVDHAIERVGTIQIILKKQSSKLHFFVIDDGRGIDLERVKSKAIEQNLISALENFDENEILNLIFQPEFSTKIEVTEISGRGIGLDAVKTAVQKFGGKISVETEKGKGTTFEISLPLRKVEQT